MRIAIEKATGNVLYQGDITLTTDRLIGNGFEDLRMTPETCDLIEHEALHPWYGGGAWVFDGTAFTLAQWAQDDHAAQVAALARDQAKVERQAAVERIVVTTAAGNTFDGDETSQTRMARAIIALQATGTPTVTWVLADNSVIQASVAELTEALALAGAAQAAIWVI